MITYEDYKFNGGTLSEDEFNSLLKYVYNLFDLYIKNTIPSWRVKTMEEYGMDLTIAFVEQIDFIAINGGVNVFRGRSDYNIKSVTTGGINLSLDNSNIEMFNGIPFAPISSACLVNEMKRLGLLSRLL